MIKSESDVSIVKLGDDTNIYVSQQARIQEEFRDVWGKTGNNSNYIRHKNTLDKMRATENQKSAMMEDKQYERVSSWTNYNIHLSKLPAKWLIEKTKEAFERSTCLQGSSGGIIVALIVLYSTIITLWPQSNVIKYPEYWFESLGPIITGYLIVDAANTITNATIVMNVVTLQSWKKYFQLLMSIVIGYVASYVSIYLIWVHGFSYRHPMPFIGQACLMISYIVKVISFWFLFPQNERKNKDFRKRLIGYMCLFPLYFLIAQAYTQLSSLFFSVPLNVQWCLGFFVPVLKKFNMWIAAKIAFKAAGGATISAKLAMICGVGGMHSFMMVLLLASKVQPMTAYLVMTLDCLPNLWSCVKIVKMHRHRSDVSSTLTPSSDDAAKTQLKEAVQCLTLKESLELFIPVVYCASFVIAYHGPNAKIMGNIRNDYWQFEKVENLFGKLSTVGIFFTIDAVRAIISALSLWYFCEINVCKTYCHIMYHYGILILFYIMAALNVVFIVLLSYSFLALTSVPIRWE